MRCAVSCRSGSCWRGRGARALGRMWSPLAQPPPLRSAQRPRNARAFAALPTPWWRRRRPPPSRLCPAPALSGTHPHFVGGGALPTSWERMACASTAEGGEGPSGARAGGAVWEPESEDEVWCGLQDASHFVVEAKKASSSSPPPPKVGEGARAERGREGAVWEPESRRSGLVGHRPLALRFVCPDARARLFASRRRRGSSSLPPEGGGDATERVARSQRGRPGSWSREDEVWCGFKTAPSAALRPRSAKTAPSARSGVGRRARLPHFVGEAKTMYSKTVRAKTRSRENTLPCGGEDCLRLHTAWERRGTKKSRQTSEGIQTIIWTLASVDTPHWSVAFAVILGWAESNWPVLRVAMIDSPVPRAPWSLEDHWTVMSSPFGSETMAERDTAAPKAVRGGVEDGDV